MIKRVKADKNCIDNRIKQYHIKKKKKMIVH